MAGGPKTICGTSATSSVVVTTAGVTAVLYFGGVVMFDVIMMVLEELK